MSRRTERIAKVMQQSIGRILLTEMSDPRIVPARTSVTRVEVQEDLLRAKVYISVMGGQPAQDRTIEALNHAAGRIQILMREDVHLRLMPVLVFLTDEQFKTALKTWEIIRQAMDELERDQARRGESASTPEKDSATDKT